MLKRMESFEVEGSGGITGGLYWTFERCGEV
jgi:hypothetical protein